MLLIFVVELYAFIRVKTAKIEVKLVSNLKIEFNGRLYTDALRVISDEFVQIKYGSPVHPCIITPQDGEDYLYLILPMHKI